MSSQQRAASARGGSAFGGSRQHRLIRFAWLVILFTVHCSLFTGIIWACPLCKEALFSPGESAAQSGVVKGYLVSIVALLGTPIVLLGGITALVLRSMRRAKRL